MWASYACRCVNLRPWKRMAMGKRREATFGGSTRPTKGRAVRYPDVDVRTHASLLNFIDAFSPTSPFHFFDISFMDIGAFNFAAGAFPFWDIPRQTYFPFVLDNAGRSQSPCPFLTSPTPPIYSAAALQYRTPALFAAPPPQLPHRCRPTAVLLHTVALLNAARSPCPLSPGLAAADTVILIYRPVVCCCRCPHPCRRLSSRCRTRDPSAALVLTYERILLDAMPVGELEEKHRILDQRRVGSGQGVYGCGDHVAGS
ncbi:hypothetical protein GGX14DRAFT_210137 [Mycena pura]|uniref:Uncharacterized protein n=1 Tax=Mycena pura TaxID=153505 RepID=A0AAD6XZX7_9AGAR|nr:hypothetical protein GGX14DRAFT_210137 [Mycena pura]